MNRKVLFLGIPLLLTVLFSLLLTTEDFQNTEYSVYDLLLHLKPAVTEDEDLVLVNIDDLSITTINMYPISRDIFADGLMLMREMGADYAILDIEFIDKSPAGLNNAYLEEKIPEQFNSVFNSLSEQQRSFIQALQNRQIPLDEAGEFLPDLESFMQEKQYELLADVNGIARDNDVYLGRAVSFFGNVISTVNMMDGADETTPQELKDLAREKVSLNRYFSEPYEGFAPAAEIKPAISQVLSASLNAGYPRVNIDPDGVRRRIDLIYDYQGEYYPQLGFSALLERMDIQAMEMRPGTLVLKGALKDGENREDISIPLDKNGKMLINWPAKNFQDSFRHISFALLYRHDRLLDDLVYNLKALSGAGLMDYPFYEGDYNPMEIWDYASMLRQDHMDGVSQIDMDEYVSMRDLFISEIDSYLSADSESRMLSVLDAYLEDPNLTPEDIDYISQLQEYIPNAFAASRDLIGELQQIREKLRDSLEGSLSVIGYSGTSTTDIGVNPFEEEYMNMGLYAAVTNTILSGSFLQEGPIWLSIAIALVLSLLTSLIVSRMKHPVWGLVSGAGLMVLTVVGLSAVFIMTGIFNAILMPGLTVLLTFIAVVSINLVLSSREKGFIRNAFAQYLSDDVIKDLLDDPSKLALGGEERHMTAIFTDVKGFSSISEKLTPQNLVGLLNDYLTEMSNLILAEKGTIDKYEGDAIIAFFGAPQPYEDHAEKTCRAAIRMKKAEKVLNEAILAEGRSPGPLMTRIGINTGDMVVGNMGTLQKMDYTMMGNAVNLAARLEGVNKQYGTWILISDSTYRETGDLFTVRMLDRVRVVGINEPVRLYELVDEKHLTPDNVLEGLSYFHKGMELFEAGKWSEANEMFKKTRQSIPEDAPSEIYMKRCLKFSQDPPPKDWDGIFNLSQK